MSRFSHFLAIDWSGAKGARQKGIALAIADAAGGPPVLIDAGRGWSRAGVLAILRDALPADTLIGADLGISLPYADCGAFFPGWELSPPDAKTLWQLVDEICQEDDHFAAQSFVEHPEASRFFRRYSPSEGTLEGDMFRCDAADHGKGRLRLTEHRQGAMGCKPCSNFNLIGANQVGKSSLTGMRILHRLRGVLPVWPIDPLPAKGSVLVEIYTALSSLAAQRRAGMAKIRDGADLDRALIALGSAPVHLAGEISDHASDALITAAWLRANADRAELWSPEALTPAIARTEGWTFGAI